MAHHKLPTLPPDIWLKILSHLPPQTLHNVTQTCKYLHQIGISETLFQHYLTSHCGVPPQAPLIHTWREIHKRASSVRRPPIYECFNSPVPIIPITPVADSLLVHIPSQRTLHAFPHTWSLHLSFLHGCPNSAVPLSDFRVAIVDSANIVTPRLHIIDSRNGKLESFHLPPHPRGLSAIPGRTELLLPAENFESLVYYPGVLRVVKISDLSTFDIPSFKHLLLGESPQPLIEGYSTKEVPEKICNLRGEWLTTLPLSPDDKLLTVATNEDITAFTARIRRENAVVAFTKSRHGDWWTHLHPPQSPRDHSPVHMFYNGTRTLLLPGQDIPRMTIIEPGTGEALQTIRAARVRGVPFDSGAVSYGGDIVILCAKRVGTVSLFDINTGACIRSLRFFRGRVDDVFFVGGAWIVGWRNEGCCVFEAWRFSAGELFGTGNEVMDNLGSGNGFIEGSETTCSY